MSHGILVQDLITHKGDVHHLFPKDYLKANGLQKGKYNQIANYVMMQSEINIAIRNKAPSVYFSEIMEYIQNGKAKYGAITDHDELMENFRAHCIPEGIVNMDIGEYVTAGV